MNKSILENIAKHITLTTDEEGYFLSLLQLKIVKRKQKVLEGGAISRATTFVIKGCLRVYSTDESGNDHTVLFAPAGWWCGDLFSFLTKSPATYNMEALEDSEILQISSQNLETLYRQVPKFERFFRILFQNGFIMYQRRITGELSLPARNKYARFKKQYPGLEHRIAQKHIASYLGITAVFLSILRKKEM